MRRYLSATLIIIIVFTVFCNPVFAVSTTFDLDDLGLQVTIPTGYLVFTRDISADDPILGDFGITKSDLIDQFESSNIYLNAVADNTYGDEIIVTMTENDVINFSLFSDTELEAIASIVADEYKYLDIKVSEYELYQHPQAKFVRLHFTDTNETVHGLQYYTVYDNKAISFTIRSYVGILSSEQETILQTVVDSIVYDEEPPIVEQGEDTDPFLFTDTNNGTTFIVPANWKQDTFTKEREYLDVKFVSTKEDGCIMMYGSTDIWEQLPASDRVGYTRSELNSSALTESYIAEIYDITADEISTVIYNGVQYFKIETEQTSDVYGIAITTTLTQLITMDDGCLYCYQFGGASTHKLYSDFESLLNSVKYSNVINMEADFAGSADIPVDNTKSPVSSTNSETSGKPNGNSGTIVVVSLLVIVALLAVVAFVPKKKCAAPEVDAPTCNTSASETENDAELILLCKSCGHSLPLDSEYCHICGTKVEKGTLP